MWRYTADLLFILESPAVREGFFPTSEHRYFFGPAGPDDWPAMRAIAVACEPPESVVIYEDWWRRLPGAFWTARDGAGRVAGFTAAIQITEIPRTLFDADPLARIWRDDVRRSPVPRGQRILCIRGYMANPEDPDSALVVAALILNMKRIYMELRPELRRVYNILPERYGPGSPWTTLGFRSILDAPVTLGGLMGHTPTWARR
jgi:hypothetical protein